jgi:hypothetical protein
MNEHALTAIERWADDHFTQGEVAVVMRLAHEFGWHPPTASEAENNMLADIMRRILEKPHVQLIKPLRKEVDGADEAPFIAFSHSSMDLTEEEFDILSEIQDTYELLARASASPTVHRTRERRTD